MSLSHSPGQEDTPRGAFESELAALLTKPMLDGDDLDRHVPFLVGKIEQLGGIVDRTMLKTRGVFLKDLSK